MFFLILTPIICINSAAAESDRWKKTIDTVTASIVSIHIEVPRAFETSSPLSSQGTGFVVDAKRGILLTNRHIVQAGPVTATAVFMNQEELELTPIYRDPVHDFGFFRYDPTALKHLTVKSLVLHPELATVGVEIRVIGNDAGEKLSILDGTLARLNREAPKYGAHQFNDFNTFYIQAASGASGGSSGSPVINEQGQVLALQAGGSFRANTNMFFPLDRVEHALKKIQNNETIIRGSLQTTFVHRSFAELKRLGLKDNEENVFREEFPDSLGALIVADLISQGPTAQLLEPGDILYRVDGQLINQFIPLESYLDSHVAQNIQLEVIRGGKLIIGNVEVSSLTDITPTRYLEIGQAVLHNLSYQQVRHMNRPLKGVVLAASGYMFSNAGVSTGSIISSINKIDITNLDDAIAALESIPEGKEFPVRFFSRYDPQNDSLSIVKNDRQWHSAKVCDHSLKIDDVEDAGWVCHAIKLAPPKEAAEVQNAEHPTQQTDLATSIAPSLVWVQFTTPYKVDGGTSRNSGSGLIIDAEKGLIVVDRSTVPASLGEIKLTFAGSVRVAAEVAFIHPLHNLALLKYDPSLLGTTNVQSAKLSSVAPVFGDEVHVVGTNYDYKILEQKRTISSYSPLKISKSRVPKFQDANLMVITTDSTYKLSSGVFLNDDAEVVAMILSYRASVRATKKNFWAVPAQQVSDLISLYNSGKGTLQSLEVEWSLIPFVSARRLGIPEQWLQKIAAKNPDNHQLLSVKNTWKGSPAEALLLSGDLLLAIDGEILTKFRDVENAIQKPTVNLTIARESEILELTIDTVTLSGMGTERLILWAGASIQDPHRALKTQIGITEPGVYVSSLKRGSPAQRFKIKGLLITHVDDQATPNLDSFIRAVENKKDRDSVRLKVIDMKKKNKLITLKLNNTFWPLAEISLSDQGWSRKEL